MGNIPPKLDCAHRWYEGLLQEGRMQGVTLWGSNGWLWKRRPRASQCHGPPPWQKEYELISLLFPKVSWLSNIYLTSCPHVLVSWSLSAVWPLLPLCMACPCWRGCRAPSKSFWWDFGATAEETSVLTVLKIMKSSDPNKPVGAGSFLLCSWQPNYLDAPIQSSTFMAE